MTHNEDTLLESITALQTDLDAQRVWAWSEGRALLVLRDLETLTDRMLDEWMSRNLTDLDARQVVRVERQGRLVRDGVELDLALDAGLSGGEWGLQAPWRARADPQSIALLAQLAAGLRVEQFADLGVRTRVELGLDPPRFTLEATTLRDERAKLSFGGDLEGRMLVASDRRPWSGVAEPEVVELAAAPALDFVDSLAWRVPRAQVDELVVERAGLRTELRREASGGKSCLRRPLASPLPSVLLTFLNSMMGKASPRPRLWLQLCPKCSRCSDLPAPDIA